MSLLAPAGAAGQEEGTASPILVAYHDEADLDEALVAELRQADPTAERVDVLTATAELTPAEVSRLRRDPDVAVVEPDAPVRAADFPNDPCYTSPALQCGQIGGVGAWHIDRVALPFAWSLTHGQGSVVAILDSGVNAAITELQGQVVGEVAAASGPPCVTDPDGDPNHGTAVATVAAARTNNSVGTAGTGWSARVLSVRVFEQSGNVCTANVSDIITGIDLAISAGVEVINLSITTDADSSLLRQAIGRALAAGIPVIAAAGNAGSSNPASGGYPAFYPEVIAVGATTRNPNAANDPRASFSNFGSWVDIYAPGTRIPAYTRSGSLVLVDGTSFSTPIVSGIVALMRALHPVASPAQIASTLPAAGTPLLDVAGAVTVNASGALLTLPTADHLLRATATPGSIDRAFSYGLNSWDYLLCDFDGDGIDGVVAFASGSWFWRSTADAGPPHGQFAYGATGYRPVCGDWDGDGDDGIGVFVDGAWYLRDSATPGPPHRAFAYGIAGYTPVVGNWNGTPGDGIGVFVNGAWYLRDSPTPGPPQRGFLYGIAGYIPVVGNWNGTPGDGDGVGVYVDGDWYLRETATPGAPDRAFAYGTAGWRPIVGTIGTPNVDGVGVVLP